MLVYTLSLAFNIKSYAAIFGALYLFDKKYKNAILSVIFSLILFLLPFCFLNGGFFKNFMLFISNLKSFGDSGIMIGFRPFICAIFDKLQLFPNCSKIIKMVAIFLSVVLCIMLFISGLRTHIQWKRIMSVTLILILLPSNFGYILSFMLLPIIFFLRDEIELTVINLSILLLFLLLTAPFYIVGQHFAALRLIIANIILIILAFWLIFDCLINHNS